MTKSEEQIILNLITTYLGESPFGFEFSNINGFDYLKISLPDTCSFIQILNVEPGSEIKPKQIDEEVETRRMSSIYNCGDSVILQVQFDHNGEINEHLYQQL